MENVPQRLWEQGTGGREPALFPQLYAPTGEEPVFDIGYILRILKKRKWMIITPLLIVLPVVMWLLAVQKAEYNSAATLLFEPGESLRIVKIENILRPDNSGESRATELKLVESRAIVDKVIERLEREGYKFPDVKKPFDLVAFLMGLPKNTVKGVLGLVLGDVKTGLLLEQIQVKFFGKVKEHRAFIDPAEAKRRKRVSRLIKATTVYRVGRTRLVRIRVKDTNPYHAAVLANTLAEVYVQQNFENKLETTNQASSWLHREVETLRASLQNAESTLQAFMKQRELTPIDLQSSQNGALEGYAELHTAYTDAKTNRIDLESQIKAFNTLLQNPSENQQILVTLLNNKSVESLYGKYLELKQEHLELSNQFKEKHPKMIEINAKMREVKNQIDDEIGKNIESIKLRYAIVLSKERSFFDDMEAKKEKYIKINADINEYRRLKRDIDSKRSLYDMMLQRLNETDVTKGLQTNNVKILERARIPREPIPTKKGFMFFVSFLVVGCFGIGTAFLLETLKKRFKSPEEVERHLRTAFLGVIPRYPVDSQQTYANLITLHRPHSAEADCYRNIRTNVQFIANGKPIRSLLITSAIPGEGKSTTTANLGVSFAQLGKRILLIDADLRRPTLHKIFHLSNTKGLSDILIHDEAWDKLVRDSGIDNVKVLSTGLLPHNPTELLSSAKMKQLHTELQQSFDLIIYDAPIALSISDSAVIAPEMDGVILIHNPEIANKEMVTSVKRILDRSRANVIGVVFNKVKVQDNTYGSYYGYYSYNSSNHADALILKKEKK